MITVRSIGEDGTYHVSVDTQEDMDTWMQEHGGEGDNEFVGLPYGEETPIEMIGEATCNDETCVCFYAPDAETARRIWDAMF